MDSKFELLLFESTLFKGSDHLKIEKQYGGSLSKWTGTLMHITMVSEIDLCYPCMHQSGCVSCPNEPIFSALHQTMQYLFHHPHLLIMYLSKEMKCGGNVLITHWGKGTAEYLPSSLGNGLANFNDADHARDLCDHCSIPFSLHLLNGVDIS